MLAVIDSQSGDAQFVCRCELGQNKVGQRALAGQNLISIERSITRERSSVAKAEVRLRL